MPPRLARYLTRSLWIKCHIYLALVFGLGFSLIGLSGSLCIYAEAIDSWLNPELVVESSNASPLPLDKMLASLRQAEPNRHGAWTLELPRTPNGTITAWFDKPRESVDKRYAPLMVAINPYSGEIVSQRFWGQTFATWLTDLHTRLLLEDYGRELMAVMAALLSISAISGLYLWWPGIAGLPRAFRLRRSTLMHLLIDCHRLLGLASAGVLLLLAFTGFHLAYPDLLETLTAAEGMGHGDAGPNIRSTAVPTNRPTSIAEAVLVARGLFPRSEVRRITTPVGDLGTYRINLRQQHELNQHHPFTTVWVDRWSGQIRGVNNPNQFSAGQTFTTWQWPLHTGEAFGDGGRLLWFFAGLTPSLLFASGLLHWLHRQGWIKDRPLDLAWTLRVYRYRSRQRLRHYRQQSWQTLHPLSRKALRWLRTRLAELKQ